MKQFGTNPRAALDKAFTLIELLVVVAIISILASIAVPNFLEAQIRAKVARAKNDIRAFSTAIETYRIDHNSVPPRHYTKGNTAKIDGGQPLAEKTLPNNPYHQATELSRLTTPVAYISSLLPDVFDTTNPPPLNLLDYWDEYQTMWFFNISPRLVMEPSQQIKSRAEAGYTIFSVGPDGYLGARVGSRPDNGWPTLPGPLVYTMYRPYDPTNGTVSAGNIYYNSVMGGLEQTPQRLTDKYFFPGEEPAPPPAQ